MIDFSKFQNLGFEDYRQRALDPTLSEYEKVGFPDVYRIGYGEAIFADILGKLTHLQRPNQLVLDIGPGCSELPRMMIDLCRAKGHTLIMVDSQEMLDLLPDAPFLTKIGAYFPDQCAQLFEDYAGKFDVINCYGVGSVVYEEGNLYRFFDRILSLMAHGSQCLIGELPNVSQRKRFFSSPSGVRAHQTFTQSDELPTVKFNQIEHGFLDDAVLMSLMMRARLAGYHGYIVPQNPALPLANRREDILIYKP